MSSTVKVSKCAIPSTYLFKKCYTSKFEFYQVNPGSWSPVHSVGSMVGTEAHPETDGSIFDPDLTGDSCVFGEDESAAAIYWAECEMQWCKVEAGACLLDPNNPPKWYLRYL